jgi:hypothetical protein
MQAVIQLLQDLVNLHDRVVALETQVAQLRQDAQDCPKKSVFPLAQDAEGNYDSDASGGGHPGVGRVYFLCETKAQPEVERERSGLERRGGGGTVAGNLVPVEILREFQDLDTPAVVAALTDWYEYRRERRLAKWQQRTLRQKLTELQQYGPAGIVAAIQRSIGNGWQGLFAPDAVEGKGAKAQASVVVHTPNVRTPEQDLRDEWYKWHSRVNGFVPAWAGAQQAMDDIEILKEKSRQNREKQKTPEVAEK